MIEKLSDNLKGQEFFNIDMWDMWQLLFLISLNRNVAIIHKQGIAKLCAPLPRRTNYAYFSKWGKTIMPQIPRRNLYLLKNYAYLMINISLRELSGNYLFIPKWSKRPMIGYHPNFCLDKVIKESNNNLPL